MRTTRILRETMRREARRAAGVHPLNPTHSAGHTAQASFDYELLALPEIVDDLDAIQDADGNFMFMVGFSSVGGPDEVM